MSKLYSLLPQFVREMSLLSVIIFAFLPLVILFLIDTSIRNNARDRDSQSSIHKFLAFLIGVWFIIAVFVVFVKLFVNI